MFFTYKMSSWRIIAFFFYSKALQNLGNTKRSLSWACMCNRPFHSQLPWTVNSVLGSRHGWWGYGMAGGSLHAWGWALYSLLFSSEEADGLPWSQLEWGIVLARGQTCDLYSALSLLCARYRRWESEAWEKLCRLSPAFWAPWTIQCSLKLFLTL